MNSSTIVIASEMSRSGSHGSLKGKDRLARGALRDWTLQGVGRGEVYGNAQEIGEPIFKANHVEQGVVPRRVEFRDQIDIGPIRRVSARNGPVKAQMDDAARFQLRFMLTQYGDHMIPVHACTLPGANDGRSCGRSNRRDRQFRLA